MTPLISTSLMVASAMGNLTSGDPTPTKITTPPDLVALN
jgi:hypothetical protein